MPTVHRPSAAVRRALRQLGLDLREARQRRRLTAAVVAQRAFTSRPTLRRIEAGDPGVSIGIYSAVLQALGFLDRVAELGAPARDQLGLALAAEALPRRVRQKRPSGPSTE
jgi:transcriptional regulator with XRE-family HTH domain